MNPNRHFTTLTCGLLASLWLASPAQETPEPQPAAVEAVTAAQKLLGQGKADAAEEKLRAALREPRRGSA
jgi:hypothetical protein